MRPVIFLFVLSRPLDAQAEEAAIIRHRPVDELRTGRGRLRFAVRGADQAGTIVVRHGPSRGRASDEVVATRTGEAWLAELPAAAVRPPTLFYYAVERMPDGTERPVFASREDPHPVVVLDSATTTSDRERLDAIHGRRYEARAAAQAASFGARRLVPGAGPQPDRYYGVEGTFAYHLLTAVDRVAVTAGTLRGRATPFDPEGDLTAADPIEIGIDYGEAQIDWFVAPVLRLLTSALFAVSQEGFESGGAIDVVLGRPSIASLAVGVMGVTTLGWESRLRLGWATVPRVPMGATIAAGNFPAGEDGGIRLLGDVGFVLSPAVLVRLEGGYQGRTNVTGGPGAAIETVFRF